MVNIKSHGQTATALTYTIFYSYEPFCQLVSSLSFRTLHCVLVSAKYRNSSFPPRNTSAGDCAPCASLPMPICQGDFGGHLERLRGWNFSLSSISNLSEHGEFLIWSLLLEKFQPLRLSYDRKPEPWKTGMRRMVQGVQSPLPSPLDRSHGNTLSKVILEHQEHRNNGNRRQSRTRHDDSVVGGELLLECRHAQRDRQVRSGI